jgi:hypothetical protein
LPQNFWCHQLWRSGTNNSLQCKHSRRSRFDTPEGEGDPASEANPRSARERGREENGPEQEKKSFERSGFEEDGPGRRWGILHRHFQTVFPPRFPDEFGARTVRVRGAVKVMAHLMFGVLAVAALAIWNRLC